jgi:hypothetical protein
MVVIVILVLCSKVGVRYCCDFYCCDTNCSGLKSGYGSVVVKVVVVFYFP